MDLFNQVKAAQKRLKGQAHVTPVMTSQTLNRIAGAEVFLKCENFQRMGAFKFRGAFNAMSRLTDEQKKDGVITHSSGNHAQAVALVGRLLGIQTTVVMPDNAPAVKRTATQQYGATVICFLASSGHTGPRPSRRNSGGQFEHPDRFAWGAGPGNGWRLNSTAQLFPGSSDSNCRIAAISSAPACAVRTSRAR